MNKRKKSKMAKLVYLKLSKIKYNGDSIGDDLRIEIEDDGSSSLISNVQHEPEARALYSISQKIFTLNGKTYKAERNICIQAVGRSDV